MSHPSGTGVYLVLNLMAGYPGQTRAEALDELEQVEALVAAHPGVRVSTERNLLELERTSPMGRDPGRFGIVGVRAWPWASCLEWHAPAWREELVALWRGHHMTTELPDAA